VEFAWRLSTAGGNGLLRADHEPHVHRLGGDGRRIQVRLCEHRPQPHADRDSHGHATPTGNVRPFGEYVQEVIDELEQRKATDVSAT
jgi:hypothetical protein